MSKKPLTEDRFKEILKEVEKNRRQKKRIEILKALSLGNIIFWGIGAFIVVVLLLFMSFVGFSAGLYIFAQIGYESLASDLFKIFDFLLHIGLFASFTALVLKIAFHVYKKKVTSDGQ